MNVEDLIRASVAGMEPPTYPGPERGVLRMDANTNLIGRNPAVERALARIASIDLNQYPTCLSDDLRSAIALSRSFTCSIPITSSRSRR